MQQTAFIRWILVGAVGLLVIPCSSAQVRRAVFRSTLIGENVKPAHAIDAPGREPIGVAWGNELLWVVDEVNRFVLPVDPFTGDPGGAPIPLPKEMRPGPAAFDSDQQVLWIIDNPSARSIRLNPGKEKGEPRIARIPIEDPGDFCFFPISRRADTGSLSGIGWDGTAPWICMRGKLCAALIRVDLAKDWGTTLATSAGCDPQGLAIDPTYRSLWIATGRGRTEGALLIERSLTDQYDFFDRPVSVLTTRRYLTLDSVVQVSAITASEDAIWVLDSEKRRLFRFDVF